MIEKSLKLDVLIICYSNLKIDPRVLRQIEFLGKTNSVTTAGLHPSEHENEIDFVKINLDNNRTYVFHYNYPKIFRKMVSLFYVLPKIILNKIREYYLFKVVRNYEKHYWNAQRLSDLDKLSKLNFLFIKDEDFMIIDGKLCRLSHHPYSDNYNGVVRNFLQKGIEDFLIHGHTHQSRKIIRNQIHIGVDSWDYCPVSLCSIKEIIND